MNWKDTLRTMVVKTIRRLENENKNAWGNEGEENLDLMFPSCETAKIIIDGAEHKIKIYFILDDELPASLRHTY